jgi:RimJ/RimL family protein N-acetyltransferase
VSVEYLSTERVRLRQPEESDAEFLLELDSDPEVMRFLTGGRASTPEEVEATIARIVDYRERFSERLGVFMAEERSTGGFMGWFHLRPDKNDLGNLRDLELGYRLKRACWGRGIASEVSRALIDRAFTFPETESVFAKALVGNAASRRVMEKLGLRYLSEGLEPGHEGLGPAATHRLSREEWTARRPR